MRILSIPFIQLNLIFLTIGVNNHFFIDLCMLGICFIFYYFSSETDVFSKLLGVYVMNSLNAFTKAIQITGDDGVHGCMSIAITACIDWISSCIHLFYQPILTCTSRVSHAVLPISSKATVKV